MLKINYLNSSTILLCVILILMVVCCCKKPTESFAEWKCIERGKKNKCLRYKCKSEPLGNKWKPCGDNFCTKRRQLMPNDREKRIAECVEADDLADDLADKEVIKYVQEANVEAMKGVPNKDNSFPKNLSTHQMNIRNAEMDNFKDAFKKSWNKCRLGENTPACENAKSHLGEVADDLCWKTCVPRYEWGTGSDANKPDMKKQLERSGWEICPRVERTAIYDHSDTNTPFNCVTSHINPRPQGKGGGNLPVLQNGQQLDNFGNVITPEDANTWDASGYGTPSR
jgi:hypothetical protein